MLIHIKSILALTKHRMHKENSAQAKDLLAELCLICEKQVSMMARLLALCTDKLREVENWLDKVLG